MSPTAQTFLVVPRILNLLIGKSVPRITAGDAVIEERTRPRPNAPFHAITKHRQNEIDQQRSAANS
jgi:hypothetical protein